MKYPIVWVCVISACRAAINPIADQEKEGLGQIHTFFAPQQTQGDADYADTRQETFPQNPRFNYRFGPRTIIIETVPASQFQAAPAPVYVVDGSTYYDEPDSRTRLAQPEPTVDVERNVGGWVHSGEAGTESAPENRRPEGRPVSTAEERPEMFGPTGNNEQPKVQDSDLLQPTNATSEQTESTQPAPALIEPEAQLPSEIQPKVPESAGAESSSVIELAKPEMKEPEPEVPATQTSETTAQPTQSTTVPKPVEGNVETSKQPEVEAQQPEVVTLEDAMPMPVEAARFPNNQTRL